MKLGPLKNDLSSIDQAIDVLHESVALGRNSYNLACAYALKSDKKNALKYLAQSINGLNMTTEAILNDVDWKYYLNDADFDQIIRGRGL